MESNTEGKMLKKNHVYFFAYLMILCFATATATNAASAQNPDLDFAIKAASAGKMEVELGRLATKKGRSAAVRSFGRRMVTDHTRAGNKLNAIARRKDITLLQTLDAEAKAKMDQLAQLSGAAFDRAYMDMMVSDHEAAVSLFETEATGGTDAELKAFAAATLPTLKMHLSMAKQTASKVK
jgi:putative membrane protein